MFECKLLTINIQQGVQEAVGFILQSIVGSQRHREVPIGLFVTYKHLNICREKRGQMFQYGSHTI